MEPLKIALSKLHGCVNKLTQKIAFFEHSPVPLTEQQNDAMMAAIDAQESDIKDAFKNVSDVIKKLTKE